MSRLRRPQPLGLSPTFGFGDRLGSATLGHLDAIWAHGNAIKPIFAQQSSREMQRTGRSATDVMKDASNALRKATYQGVWSADADHIKSQEEVNVAAGAKFVIYTIDPSDHVDLSIDSLSFEEVADQHDQSKGEFNWADQYIGRTISIEDGPLIELNEDSVKRTALKYGRAITHAMRLAEQIDGVMTKQGKQEYEIELSVDESPRPTSLVEHYIIADQCLRSEMKLISLALRYVGRFEKGVDFNGDFNELSRFLSNHASLARHLGPYKLSMHSGSDKFSIYEMFARATRGMFHVKTAGTSYLEALRVVARHDCQLFRRIIDTAREHFEEDRNGDMVSANLDSVSAPSQINDHHLIQEYLDKNDGRQILHVTFGTVLSDLSLGPRIHELLQSHEETYRHLLAHHFGRHLAALNRGLQPLGEASSNGNHHENGEPTIDDQESQNEHLVPVAESRQQQINQGNGKHQQRRLDISPSIAKSK